MGKMLNPEAHSPATESESAELQKQERASVDADIAELESQIAEAQRIQAEKKPNEFLAEDKIVVGRLAQNEEDLVRRKADREALFTPYERKEQELKNKIAEIEGKKMDKDADDRIDLERLKAELRDLPETFKEDGGTGAPSSEDILAEAPKKVEVKKEQIEAPKEEDLGSQIEGVRAQIAEAQAAGKMAKADSLIDKLAELRRREIALQLETDSEVAEEVKRRTSFEKPPTRDDIQERLDTFYEEYANAESTGALSKVRELQILKKSIGVLRKMRSEMPAPKKEAPEARPETPQEFITRYREDQRLIRDNRIAEIEKELGSIDQIARWRTAGRLKEELAELKKERIAVKKENGVEWEKGELEALQKIETQGKKIDAKAESLGFMDRVRSAGEWYKKQSFKAKMGASLALFGASAGAAALGGALGATVGVTALFLKGVQRGFATAGTFVSVEALLKNRVEQGEGRERTTWEARRHTIEAGLAAVLVGSGAVGEALKNGMASFHEFLGEYFQDPEITNNASAELGERFAGGAVNRVAESAADSDIPTPMVESGLGEALIEGKLAAAEGVLNVEDGDNLWGLIKKSIEGATEGKTDLQKNFITDSLYKKLESLNPDELRELGIPSGDPSVVHAGESIDLTRLYAGEIGEGKSVDDIFAAAEKLTGSGAGSVPEVPMKEFSAARAFAPEGGGSGSVGEVGGAEVSGNRILNEMMSDGESGGVSGRGIVEDMMADNEVNAAKKIDALRQGIRDTIDQNSRGINVGKPR